MHCAKHLSITLAAFSAHFSRISAHKSHELSICSSITTTLTPQLFPDLNSERIKVNYGPFTVPLRSENHGMKKFKCATPAPCKDCTILWMQAGLEYMDGSDANAESGMWLHHTVWQNMKGKDRMCKNRKGERFFASGNERTPIDLTSAGLSRYGYSLGSKEELGFGFEAMNMDEGERDVVLTMTWEFIPSPPKNFRKVQPYWFDVGGCDRPNMPAKPDSVFSYSSSPVKAPTSGVIAVAAGHLHDGGTKLEVTRQGDPFCVTRAVYDGGHIKKITTCDTLAYSKGDEFSITAHYNTSKHDPMTHPNGELEPVMGIALIYAVEDASNKKYEKRLKRNIAIAAFSVAFILTLLGLVWLRYQRKNGSRVVLPAWLRRQYSKIQSCPVDGYQTLEETGDRVEYRD